MCNLQPHQAVRLGGIISSLAFLVLSILTLVLYVNAFKGVDTSCDSGHTVEHIKFSDSTAAMGIISSSGCLYLTLVAIPSFYFLNHGRLNIIAKMTLFVTSSILWICWLISWALLAHDMDEWKFSTYAQSSGCGVPPIWGAALCFGLLAWLASAAVGTLSFMSWYIGKDH